MAQMTAADIQKIYAEGLAFQNAGKLDAALKTYGRIVAANPKIAEAHFQIGRILTGANQIGDALRHLKEAVRLRPAESAVWLAWADAVALGGDPADEAEILRVLKSATVDAKLKILLQDRFGARRASTRPATGGMKIPDIRRLLALMDARRFPEAESLATTFVSLHPGSALALNILGSAQASQGNLAAAVANLQNAIRADPNYAEGHDNLGRILVDLKREEDAAVQFRRAVSLAPGLPSALLNLAASLTRTGEPAAALRLLERALAAGADAQPVNLAIGNAHTKLKNYQKAEEAFEKALQAAPAQAPGSSKGQSNEAIGLLAQAQARQGKDVEALANFERALAIDRKSIVATGGMATLLQTLGRFDEAQEMFRKAFDLDPMEGETYRLFSASHKFKQGDPILERMLTLYDNPALSSASRMSLGFAIAKALEDVKEYGRVFRYLDQANALNRKAHPYDMRSRYGEVESTKAAFADFDWHAARVEGTTSFAPIFVSGMPRSGTTLIEQIISSHSAVTGAGELGEGARAAHQLVLNGNSHMPVAKIPQAAIAAMGLEYEAYVRARFADVDRITDKSIQSYMFLGLLKLAMPNAKFIIVRRDPRDTLLSIYKNKFPDDTHNYAYDQRDLALYYKTFLDMVDFWRERVPDWIYEVEYEALVANPEVESRKLIAACGLEWEDACLNFHENTRKVETLSLFQVRQPISGGSVKGWKRYEKQLQPMLTALKEQGLVTD